MEIKINEYLILSILIVSIATIRLIQSRKNVISIIVSMELIIIASIINFVAGSIINNNIDGQVLVIFAITTAAIETTLCIALSLVHYDKYQDNNIKDDSMDILI